MRKSSYTFLNIVCAFSSAFFLFGSVWIWRGEWAEVSRQKAMNQVEIGVKTKFKTETDNKNLKIKNSKLEIGDHVATSTDQSKTEKAKTLPTYINLDVPFTSQAPEKDWSEPWQNLCEEAAILMMDAYYEKYNLSPLFAKDELLRIWDWEQKQGFGRSIEMEQIKVVIDNYFNLKSFPRPELGTKAILNLQSEIIENPTIDQIKNYLVNGTPALTVVYGKILPNPYFRNGGPEYHALVIRGYTETKFITNDPGSGWSKNYAYDYDVLMNAIHDWNGGDVKNGRKVILVIE
jgi:hypothetical protein